MKLFDAQFSNLLLLNPDKRQNISAGSTIDSFCLGWDCQIFKKQRFSVRH